MLKTDKRRETIAFEGTIGQLRHAYALLVNATEPWDTAQRQRFANGLIGPQIEQLERLARDYEQRGDDLLAAIAAGSKHRRSLSTIEQNLLARVQDIASASEARRIIFSIFRDAEK